MQNCKVADDCGSVRAVAATRAIDLRTEIPGPRSREILARKERVVAEPLSIYLPVVIQEGRGALVTDVDGNTFLDFTGGVGCLNVGHSHPRVVAAAQEQLERFSHTDFTIVPYEVYVTLSERVTKLAPIGGETRAAFFNAGTVAIENAVKFARPYTKRPAVIAFEGGFLVAPREFLRGVRRICDENGIVLVVDEVQTGYGRTGRMWAIEHYGVEPDLMVVAKSIAAGLPLSGVLGRAEIMDAPGDSAIGGTYVGNPVAQAAALAVLDVFEEESLVDRAAQLGETIRERMQAWQQRWPAIGDVRGLGAMLAIELVHDAATKDPAPELATKVVETAAERGLLLLKSGIYSNCIRVLVPLVISAAELDEALGVWEDALDSALTG